VVDKGQVTDQFGTKHKVQIRWQLDARDEENDRRYMVVNTYNATLHEKAKLREHLVSWRGRDFSKAELEKFDLENVLEKNCQIQIVHNLSNNGRTYANVQAIVPLGKGMTQMRPEDYIREKDRVPDEDYDDAPPIEDDDVPF